MKLAITGCSGNVGKRVALLALAEAYSVIGIDRAPPSGDDIDITSHPNFSFIQAEMQSYEEVLKAFAGCEGVIHLAAVPNPRGGVVETHNSNVVTSWNVLYAAQAAGIKRIAAASSVNAIGMVYNSTQQFDYFPLDEAHPCRPDEGYGLSKQWVTWRHIMVVISSADARHRILETQADAIVRRDASVRIATLRLAYSVPKAEVAAKAWETRPMAAVNDLWGYVQEDSAAQAFLLALTSTGWQGHEVFFITAPTINVEEDSAALKEKYWSSVPVKKGWVFGGRQGFFDCSKAERLLGWRHKNVD